MVDNLNIEVPSGVRLYIVGDIHEHSQQFFDLIEKVQPSPQRWLISLGDAFDKGFGPEEANEITDKLIELQLAGYGFAVKGNHELKVIKKNKKNLTPQLKWWKRQPLALSFKFGSGNRITCLHAGVEPGMDWSDLENNIEIVYVRDIDLEGHMIPLVWKDVNGTSTLVKAKEGGASWHQGYDGRFGTLYAGHAASPLNPTYYNYSCNLDGAVYETGVLNCQEIDTEGNRGELIKVSGLAAKPKLNVGY